MVCDSLYLGLEYRYDIAIIDIGLPEINGIDVIKQLRDQSKTFPISTLTARDSWQDKVAGLEAGADDYLVKPFHNEELQAQLYGVLSVTELENDSVSLPTVLTEPKFNQQQSGLYGFIYISRGEELWRSKSA
jgi:two-component system response regulator PhoP